MRTFIRRAGVALLVLVLVFSLAACGQKTTTVTTDETVKEVFTVKSLTFDCDMSVIDSDRSLGNSVSQDLDFPLMTDVRFNIPQDVEEVFTDTQLCLFCCSSLESAYTLVWFIW